MSVNYGVLHSLISTIVEVNIGLRAWPIHHLSKDVPISSELPEVLQGHLRIEVAGTCLLVPECRLPGWWLP